MSDPQPYPGNTPEAEVRTEAEPRRRRIGLLVSLSIAVLIAAISCQDSRRARAPKAAAPGGGSETAATQPVAEEADVETKPTARVDPATLGYAYPISPSKPRKSDEVKQMNTSCVACHTNSDTHTMHATDVKISCTDCHGGNWEVAIPDNFTESYEAYNEFKNATHVQPTRPNIWKTSGNPELGAAGMLKESKDYIRFVNPGDLRAAYAACASCHNTPEDDFLVDRVQTSMMTHGAMLWSAALYNNGSIWRKNPLFGEMYDVDGNPARVIANPRPTIRQLIDDGMLAQLYPLPRWEITQPGNILRVFERGGKLRPVIGIPNILDDPGRPDVKLSLRGVGTDVRTDPVFIGLQKTRLLDPTLNMMGTNDHPGDYRASGCSACHVVYANDRSPVHSGTMWAKYGNQGESFSNDPTVNPPLDGKPTTQPYENEWEHRKHREAGHPIRHEFVRSMPTSTCITCHMHPGTNVVNSYLGFMWWDNESDGQFMYPKAQKYPTADDFFAVHQHNPEGSAVRGLWSGRYPNDVDHTGERAGPDFLSRVGTPEFNAKLKHTHFADFHGHGWIFRAVFKQDRKGRMLDYAGNVVEDVSADKMARAVGYTWDKDRKADEDRKLREGVPVHLKDIHLERGMHCADCHFDQDNHGDGNLYGETRAAVVIGCVDCHGTVDEPAKMLQYLNDKKNKKANDWLADALTGPAADNGINREARAKRNKKLIDRHFSARSKRLVQKSALDSKVSWNVVQTNDTVGGESWWTKEDSTDKETARLARYAHTVRKDGKTWGDLPEKDGKPDMSGLAHGNNMSCYACHTSWNTSCFGCHLPQRANQRRPNLHNEGVRSRNYTTYNYQTLRDDVYMLGVDGTATGSKIVPIRSACAVLVSSQDANRQWLYLQQQTVSAEGFSGTAFSPYFPHTVRAAETKQCNDCHVAADGDNNAIMAQVLLQGTNSVNFIGRFAWVGLEHGGLQAVAVTEREEPQAVIGSRLHELAYPDYFKRHEARGNELELAFSHHKGQVLDLQQRGEYLYAACGPGGFIAYDIANIENKGFSERIVTAPVSPLGQRFYVKSKYATSICSPSTMAIDPTRPRYELTVKGANGEEQTIRPNEEQDIHLMYAYLYMTDREEGLIVIGNPLDDKRNKAGVATLLDGDPSNNFLQRALTFNPDGILKGARHMAFHGTHAYVAADAGVVVIDFDKPTEPRVVTVLSQFNGARKIAFQFRYAFVLDNDGMKVLDVTDVANPREVSVGLEIRDARDIYVSRTYGYIAAGEEGLVIVDLTKPEQPVIDQVFNANGKMSDATAVKVGMTNSSMFAYVADGHHGLKVIQLTSPDDTPGYMGFSPRPTPRLIAQYHTHGPAVALSEGLDRDRAVDEAGNQLSVFGRRGARPFNRAEQERLFLRTAEDGTRSIYTVSNMPQTEPVQVKTAEEPEAEEKKEGDSKPGPKRPGPRRRPR